MRPALYGTNLKNVLEETERNVALDVCSAKDFSHVLYTTCVVQRSVALDVSYTVCVSSAAFFS